MTIEITFNELEIYFWTGEDRAGMPKRSITVWISSKEYGVGVTEDGDMGTFVQDPEDENTWTLTLSEAITTTKFEIYACRNGIDESGQNTKDEWPNFSEISAYYNEPAEEPTTAE